MKLDTHECLNRDGVAVAVSTIRRRRRAVTDADALAIRDQKMLEMAERDDLSNAAIGKVFGLGERSVRAGLARARSEALEASRQRAERL